MRRMGAGRNVHEGDGGKEAFTTGGESATKTSRMWREEGKKERKKCGESIK